MPTHPVSAPDTFLGVEEMLAARRIALIAIALTVFAGAFVLSHAAAAPTPMDYDPGQIFNDTYSDFPSALNITANATETLLLYLDCGAANDYDYLYVWLPAGMDFRFHLYFEAGLMTTRTDVWLRDTEHFNLVHAANVGNGANDAYLNTTTRVAGPYFIIVGRCVNIPEYYNVTWTAAATGSVSDGDNSLSQARVITDGLGVSNSVTETTDQADFFKVDVTFTLPTRRYLQLTGFTQSGGIWFEFYNSTGVALADPATHEALDPCCTAVTFSTKAYRFPAPGTYYIRLWSHGLDSTYSVVFGVVDYTPSVSYIDYANSLTVIDGSTVTNALNYSFESAHYYKIRITSARTIWADVRSNQVDVNLKLYNESPSGVFFQKRFISRPYDDLANPKDHQDFNYTVTAADFANTTGWYYVVVTISSDLPPDGLYTVEVWVNDRPTGSAPPAVNMTEDTPLNAFDVRTLFRDLDCDLNALDPDCALTIQMLAGSAPNLTFDFYGGRWLNVTPAANWSGGGCRDFQAWDAKNLTTTSRFCVIVAEVNDAPEKTGVNLDRYNMLEDHDLTALGVGSWFRDVDGDTLTYSVSGNDNITVTIDQFTGFANLRPEANFNGFNNLTFTASDGRGGTFDIPVEFLVIAVNDPPEPRGAIPQVVIDEDTTTTLNLATITVVGQAGAFFDIDPDLLTYRIYDQLNVTVQVAGPVLTIRPDENFTGLASFSVVAFDGTNESSKAGVLVRVNPVNDAPEIVSWLPTANPTINEGESKVFQVSTRDVDADPLSYQWFVDATGIIGATRSNYTLATAVTDELGRTTVVRVVVSDGSGGSGEREWTVTVHNTNQACREPVITSPTSTTFTTDDDITFSATCLDPDGDVLTWTWYSDRLATPFGNDQSVTDKLPAGSHHIRLVVSDGNVSVEATKNVTVTAAAGPKPPGFEGPAAIAGLAAVAAVAVGLRRRPSK